MAVILHKRLCLSISPIHRYSISLSNWWHCVKFEKQPLQCKQILLTHFGLVAYICVVKTVLIFLVTYVYVANASISLMETRAPLYYCNDPAGQCCNQYSGWLRYNHRHPTVSVAKFCFVRVFLVGQRYCEQYTVWLWKYSRNPKHFQCLRLVFHQVWSWHVIHWEQPVK